MSSKDATVPKEKVPEAVDEMKTKGKTIATEEQTPADESINEDSDDDDADVAEEVEDNLEEIDSSNIVSGGRRTRGKVIDWAKAAEAHPTTGEDDEEDEDDEFVADPSAGDDDEMDED